MPTRSMEPPRSLAGCHPRQTMPLTIYLPPLSNCTLRGSIASPNPVGVDPLVTLWLKCLSWEDAAHISPRLSLLARDPFSILDRGLNVPVREESVDFEEPT